MTNTDVELDPRGQGPDAPWHVRDSRAPVRDEVTVETAELEVKGSIPPELNGRYIRNTANPQTGWTEHWFIGDGMLHGIELQNGTATWYKNRYVRTPQYAHPGADRLSLALDMENLTFDYSVSAANTHIIGHGGKCLALEEGSFPYEVTKDLDTVGAWTFDGVLEGPFTAHPKFCPDTGEMLGFGYQQLEPYLVYYRVDASGKMVQNTPITVTGPTMMHDFAASRDHTVFMDLPAIFDFELAMNGGMPIRWSDDYPPRFGVMPRAGGDADVQWFDVEPSYCFHTLNAVDEGDETIVWGFRVPEIWRGSADMSMDDGPGDPSGAPRLYEWRLNRATGAVREGYLDDASGEFPRVPPAMQGKPFRYGYSLGMADQGTGGMGGAVYKYDLHDGASKTVHRFPAGHENGETIFVPAAGATNEDDGYLMTYVWQAQTDTSYMAILDASNMEADPIAEIHVPRRIVAGFHSSWIPDAG